MSKRRLLFISLTICVGFAGCIGYELWLNLAKKGEVAFFSDPEEHFKYGSLGQNPGFPLYLWKVMPEVFQDLLPGEGDNRGWEVFGMIQEEGRDYPIGFAKQTVGFPSLSMNCALCHTGTYRQSSSGDLVVVPGAPAEALNFKAFNEFVFNSVKDERFSSAVLMPAMEKKIEMGWWEKKIYRYLLLPTVKKALIDQADVSTWMNSRPEPGCGRFDAFNLLKISVLKLKDDHSIASSDFPPLWNQDLQKGQRLHWNGSADQVREVNLISAYSVNLGAKGFLIENFDQIESYLATLLPPKYPFPIDEGKSARGAKLYQIHCAECHADGGKKTGQVTAQPEVGTDPDLLKVWSKAYVEKLESIDSPPFQFKGLKITDGYLNVRLEGCWLRAPYLHTGSVPNLWELLQPENQRSKKFYRGSNVYDSEKGGFMTGKIEGSMQSLYDTELPGNSNKGHLYGVDLSEQEKWELIEYLKTL